MGTRLDKYKRYVGRQFRFGITDCYTIVRDFYKDEYNIRLRNYARYDKFWEDESLYLKFFKNEGFYLADDELRFGDVILIAFGAKVACHAAVYLGERKILHHVQNRFSAIDNYEGIWKNWTVCVVRHKLVKNKENSIVFDIERGKGDVICGVQI